MKEMGLKQYEKKKVIIRLSSGTEVKKMDKSSLLQLLAKSHQFLCKLCLIKK